MTHGENGGCCGGSGANKESAGGCCGGSGHSHAGSKGGCCSGGGFGKLLTVASVVVAIGALVYASGKDGHSTKPAKPKVDVATLIKGDDTVVAKYNGEDIHKSDIALAIQELGAKVPPESIDAVLPAFIEQYINLRLIGDAAEKDKVAETPEAAAQLQASRDQILRAAYLRKLFEGKITEEKLKEVYKAKYEDQPMPEEVRARHILVDDEAKAKDLIAKIEGGASFEKLAAENSKDPSAQRGGDLGYFVQADMVKEFGDAAFTMGKGEVSKTPVKTQFGWHVIKVEDKRQRAKPSFEEAKPTLEQAVNQQLLEEKLAELRKASKVEVLVDTKQAAPAAEGAAAPAEAAPAEAAPAAAPAEGQK